MKHTKLAIAFVLVVGIAMANTDIVSWQGQYYIGTTFQTGVQEFTFQVYDDKFAGSMCWSNTTNITLQEFGLWQTEQYGVSTNCSDTAKDYWIDINISGVEQPPRRLLTSMLYMRKNVNEITTANITADTFYGKVNASFIQNSYWLNITDQRYNDSGVFVNYSPEIDALNLSKLNITDQRYNDSAGIDSLNSTKRNINDGQFNVSVIMNGTLSVAGATTVGNLTSAGNLIGSNYYGGIAANPYVQTFPSSNIYYNLTMPRTGILNGFTNGTNSLITPDAEKAMAVYHIAGVTGGSETYNLSVCIKGAYDSVGVVRYAATKTSLIMSGATIISMKANDIITLCMADTTGTTNITISSATLTLLRVGN